MKDLASSFHNAQQLAAGLFTFRDVDGNLRKVKHRIYGGAMANRGAQLMYMPSIIGYDFLKEKKVNMGFGQNYLSIDEEG